MSKRESGEIRNQIETFYISASSFDVCVCVDSQKLCDKHGIVLTKKYAIRFLKDDDMT